MNKQSRFSIALMRRQQKVHFVSRRTDKPKHISRFWFISIISYFGRILLCYKLSSECLFDFTKCLMTLARTTNSKVNSPSLKIAFLMVMRMVVPLDRFNIAWEASRKLFAPQYTKHLSTNLPPKWVSINKVYSLRLYKLYWSFLMTGSQLQYRVSKYGHLDFSSNRLVDQFINKPLSDFQIGR